MALALWAGAAASESRLVSQPALLAAGWVALFTLPAAYAMCRCGCSHNPAGSMPESGVKRKRRTARVGAVCFGRQRIRVHSPVALRLGCRRRSCSISLQSRTHGAAELLVSDSCHVGTLRLCFDVVVESPT